MMTENYFKPNIANNPSQFLAAHTIMRSGDIAETLITEKHRENANSTDTSCMCFQLSPGSLFQPNTENLHIYEANTVAPWDFWCL